MMKLIVFNEDFSYDYYLCMNKDYVLNSQFGFYKIYFKSNSNVLSVLKDYKELAKDLNNQYRKITNCKELKRYDRGCGVYDILSNHRTSIVEVESSDCKDIDTLLHKMNNDLQETQRKLDPFINNMDIGCPVCHQYLDTLGICTNKDCSEYIHNGHLNT